MSITYCLIFAQIMLHNDLAATSANISQSEHNIRIIARSSVINYVKLGASTLKKNKL